MVVGVHKRVSRGGYLPSIVSPTAGAVPAAPRPAPAGPPAIAPLPRPAQVPLSFGQQRLWLLDRLSGASPAYSLPVAVELEGRLALAPLARAVAEITGRHEVLRTVFPHTDDLPRQVVAARWHGRLALVDLAALPVALRRPTARGLLSAEARRPFDLAEGPLLRWILVRLGAEEHLMALVLHHIVADGRSVEVLFDELAMLYAAFLGSRRSPLPPLAVQYADYSLWQRRWLATEGALAEQLAYWRRRLGGLTAQQLASDRQPPARPSFRGRLTPLRLDGAVVEALRGWNQERSLTLFLTLLAAFKATLRRHGAGSDVAVGTAVAGRNPSVLKDLVGFFVNTIVLRTDLAGEPSFSELTERVRVAFLEAFDHQDLPFERVVEALSPQRDAGRNPFFQTLVVQQTAPEVRLSDLEAEPVMVDTATAKLDLSLLFWDRGSAIAGALEYSTDLFDATTIERLKGHFLSLLEAALADPERSLDELACLAPAQRQQLLAEWNDRASWGAASPLPAAFLARAAEQGDAVAVAAGDEWLSYGELERRSARLASRLQQAGVGAEARVAVCLPRSLPMVVSLLAVLRAEGAYVALDPAYPRQRLAFMIADSDARVIVTDSSLRHRLALGQAAAAGRRWLCLDAVELDTDASDPVGRDPVGLDAVDLDTIGRDPAGGVSSTAGAGSLSAGPAGESADRRALQRLAYVIYTSGSTGRPKGVGIEHRSVARLVQWARRAFTPRQLAGVLASTSICFDLSIFELFVPLSAGGTVFLVDNALDLVDLDAADRITLLNTVPSAAVELLRLAPLPPALGTVNLAGEALPRPLVTALYEQPPVLEVCNLYGPSEDTTYSTWGAMDPDEEAAPDIGRPLDDTRAYLLDRRQRLLPAAVAGELYLGGGGLARGYLERPSATAQRFVPDGLGESQGGRLYRTGDLARWRLDGRLEFLGRLDHQVKLRGFRIELGEIEAALTAHPQVSESVVVVRRGGAVEERSSGDERLVAYVTAADDGAPPSWPSLRSYLESRLPGYMVPAQGMVLQQLPLTPNGKVDRRALPPVVPMASSVAPRTPVEELIAGVLQEVLGVERIGVEDNFFDLGGHSLSATQVVSRLGQVLGVEPTLQQLFEAPTAARLAAALAGDLAGGRVTVPDIEPIPRGGALPLSFAQERMWFLHQLEPDSSAYNISLALRFEGALDGSVLSASWGALVERHEVLRTVLPQVDGRPVQLIQPAAEVLLPLIDLSGLDTVAWELAVLHLSEGETRRPFDLARGPLWRATLLRRRDAEHVLLLALHHSVADAWSMGILARELAQLYVAFADGRASPLAAPSIQYADFAAWQRRWLRGAPLERLSDYWRRRLADAPRQLRLPTDRPRRAPAASRGAAESMVLAGPLVAALRSVSQGRGVTLYMTLLAAFNVLLHRYSRQSDIVIGTSVANRNRLQVEHMVGFFVNMLAIRTEVAPSASFVELMHQVRDVTLGAFAHQDLPFDKLVQELRLDRSGRRNPLFQVVLTYRNTPHDLPRLPGLATRLLPIREETTIFDLALIVEEADAALHARFRYGTDLFDPATVQGMLERLKDILGTVAERPEVTVAELVEAMEEAEEGERLARASRVQRIGLQRLRSARRRSVAGTAQAARRMS